MRGVRIKTEEDAAPAAEDPQGEDEDMAPAEDDDGNNNNNDDAGRLGSGEAAAGLSAIAAAAAVASAAAAAAEAPQPPDAVSSSNTITRTNNILPPDTDSDEEEIGGLSRKKKGGKGGGGARGGVAENIGSSRIVAAYTGSTGAMDLEDSDVDNRNNNNDDNDEEIVREIDVYLSPALADKLYLLQYPLQQDPVRRPASARIKPRHALIELDIPLPNYTEREGQYGHINERKYQSQTIPVQTHLCLGKMERQEVDGVYKSALHLVPLGHISQMRPSFSHIDKATAVDDEDDPVDDSKSKEKKPILFQRKESERAALIRKSSYAFKKSSEESEEWIELDVCRPDSEPHQKIVGQIKCHEKDQHVLRPIQETTVSYVNSLNYMTVTDDPYSAFTGTDLKSVVARVTTLMASGCPIPFSLIRMRFNKDVTNETIMTAINICAVMVRGNFCLNSKFLTGIPKAFQRARTFILLILHREGMVERKRLDQVFEGREDISSERLLLTLQQVGKQTSTHWELKVEDDRKFQAAYPKHVNLHNDFWDRQEERLRRELNVYRKYN